MLVTLLVLGVQRAAARPTFLRALALFSTAAALVLLRTLFQIVWLALVVAVVAFAVPDRRRVLAAAALPCALVLGLYVKNWVMFGVASTSSWEGMGLARIAEHGYGLRARRLLVRQGALHRVSLVEPLSALGAYRRVGAAPAVHRTGIPVLDEVSGPEYPRNLHNKAYIEIAREYWHDDLWLIRHHPGRYLRSVVTASWIFFWPPDHGGAVAANAATIRPYERWYRRIVNGAASEAGGGLVTALAYAIAAVGGLIISARSLRRGADGATVAGAAATLTIAYVAVVGNLTELGENYRFRFVLDPVTVALVAFVLVRTRRRGLHAAPEELVRRDPDGEPGHGGGE